MSKSKVEVDCTGRCQSRNHGQVLTSAITKRSIGDKELASFIKGTCANFVKAFDYEGRTPLHMASSRGRTDLMSWLVNHSSEAFVNARDRESGYTPLHRSIFYGQINAAVALMKIGVKTDIVDKDDYKALDHALLDRAYMYKHDYTSHVQPCDSYVWGTNTNYTLGTGSNQPRAVPEALATFNKAYTSVKQVCLGKFHTIWLCHGADGPGVWCSGQLARSGAPHCTALRPAPLRLSEPCICAALTLNSTVLLMESGTVIQYSLNSNDNVSQSSTKTPSSIKLPSVKPLIKLSNPIGVRAAKSHAVVWNKNAVYTWGTNLGQLGHSQEDKTVATPKRVAISMNTKEDACFQLAEAGDAATVVTTSRGDVYLLHKYLCKKIAIKQINLRQVCVEGKVSEHGAHSRVTVLLLTNVGQLHIWQDTTNKLTRCVFGLVHQTLVSHMALTHDAVYMTTKQGEAYIGTISRKTTPVAPQPTKKEREKDGRSALVKFLEKDDCTAVRIVKIPNVHRAVSIAVDGEGLNFSVLQTKPTCVLTSLPDLSPSCFAKHMESLRGTAAEDDLLHDVVFQIGTKRYPAHMFVVASSSEHLYALFKDTIAAAGEKPTIPLTNIHPDVFERILKFMYTGSCDVAELGPCSLKIRREDLPGKKEKDKDNDVEFEEIENPYEVSAFEVLKSQKKRCKSKRQDTPPRPTHAYCDPVKLVQAAAKRLQVMTLHKLMDKFYYRDGKICLKDSAAYSKKDAIAWDLESFPELVDTHVRSKDGALLAAHKCVLAARLEYFNGMFMHSWTESKLLSTVTLPINYGILRPVISFLYTDSCPEIESCTESIDFICNMLVVADQLFISRLSEMCQIALANMITLKNCTELCQFAHTYNAVQLKDCCMQFISLNLSSILENRSLEILENDLLGDITKYYCKYNPIMSSRVITPFFNAPSDEVIQEFGRTYPVDIDFVDEDVKREDTVEVTRKKTKSKKVEYTESEKARMRYESVSSVNAIDLSTDLPGDITLSLTKVKDEKDKSLDKSKEDKWTKVPSTQKQKVVQARLKAISNAKDILNEPPAENFTKLNKSSAISIPDMPRRSMSPDALEAKSPQGSVFISHVGPKLSQKQRKKLSMEGIEQTPQSLNDYFSKMSVSPEKPRNPWKVVDAPVASSSPKAKPVQFNQILTDQKKQKEDHSRIMSKPLALTQLEDKAIEQLESFYNVHESDEEYITVSRIELHVSSPQWLHTAPK